MNSASNTQKKATPPELFCDHVFTHNIIKQMLPQHIYLNIVATINGMEKIKAEYLDEIACAMKDWAISKGATHYTHWFLPLNGKAAEKHDRFICLDTSNKVLEKFSGKELMQGEPDASSFPSGGLRATHEARGYSSWDPTSPVFLWESGNSLILTIPSIFYSWTDEALDNKIPHLRSEKIISSAACRLLKLIGHDAAFVYSTLGIEQEYFIIDKTFFNLRPDLVLLGRSVYGTPASKGQELQDHYFGTIKERILDYMCDVECKALKLGIPVKTRHNEVAPSQYEIAPIFEKATVAVDHNLLLMELMTQTAEKHNLSCLFHEKPFAKVNGSGKHCNWSLSTDQGFNLLDPTDTVENNVTFLILVTAILHAVHKHASLLRASIGSCSNDFRLGGHEAPPAIISVYLGDFLEDFLNNIESSGIHTSLKKINIGRHSFEDMPKDASDRNRTSPFAFTGNKFEYRAVGSSSNPALAMTVLNTIVAESLNEILDHIESTLDPIKNYSSDEILNQAIPTIQAYLKKSKAIRFCENNYSTEWKKEALTRGLPCHINALSSYKAFTTKETQALFKGVLNKNELISRYTVLTEHYIHTLNIQTHLMIMLFNTHILPAALEYQRLFAKNLRSIKELGINSSLQLDKLKELTSAIDAAIDTANILSKYHAEFLLLQDNFLEFITEKIQPSSELLRKNTDLLEQIVDNKLWPLPRYREMLYLLT